MSFVLANREEEQLQTASVQQSSDIGENREKDIVGSKLGVSRRKFAQKKYWNKIPHKTSPRVKSEKIIIVIHYIVNVSI